MAGGSMQTAATEIHCHSSNQNTKCQGHLKVLDVLIKYNVYVI